MSPRAHTKIRVRAQMRANAYSSGEKYQQCPGCLRKERKIRCCTLNGEGQE